MSIALYVAALIGCSPSVLGPQESPGGLRPTSTHVDYLGNARQTHNFVVGNLLTSFHSYRDSPSATVSDEWFDVSQIAADAAMVQRGDSSYLAYMNSTYSFMNHLWSSRSSIGGYYPRVNLDGSNPSIATQYVDDNSLSGVSYLDAMQVSTGAQHNAYLASSRAIANWLFYSKVWDSTYGGGFWWNTMHPDKPTQSNGLAVQLFSRLYQVTGATYYRDWASAGLGWLDAQLFDTNDGLYSWKVTASGVDHTKFSYDQAILIEAELQLASQTGDPGYVTKAEQLASALILKLWDGQYGGFVISTADGRRSPVLSGWATQSLIRLYEADGDAKWLDYAQQNVDALNRDLRDPVNHGYHATCNVDGTNVDSGMQEVDQAWMQRVQALLSQYR